MSVWEQMYKIHSGNLCNMTNIPNPDHICIDWAENILRSKGLGYWKITWSPEPSAEGITIQDHHEINIHWPKGKPHYALMAHEITHAVRGAGGHDGEFAYQYMKIVEEFFMPCVGPSSETPESTWTCRKCGTEWKANPPTDCPVCRANDTTLQRTIGFLTGLAHDLKHISPERAKTCLDFASDLDAVAMSGKEREVTTEPCCEICSGPHTTESCLR